MKVRGERECTDCGTRWSYYETGEIDCPSCGSLHSVGVDERAEHTDLQVTFDLTGVRNDLDEHSSDDIADRASEECREYVRRRGFIDGGSLRELDDTYLAASELLHVSDIVSRDFRLEEREELYFLSLLRDADQGERPPAADIPSSLRSARGLAYANAVDEYRRDVRTWVDDDALTSTERATLETLDDHVTRVRMLDGDVAPERADQLVDATRDLASGLRGDEQAVLQAQDRLETLEFDDAV